MSGQKVNQQKSCVVTHVNFPRIRKHSIAEISGFQTKEFPVTYWDARYMQGGGRNAIFQEFVTRSREMCCDAKETTIAWWEIDSNQECAIVYASSHICCIYPSPPRRSLAR